MLLKEICLLLVKKTLPVPKWCSREADKTAPTKKKKKRQLLPKRRLFGCISKEEIVLLTMQSS